MSSFKDLTGQIFGRLTVIGFSHFKTLPNGKNVSMWKCRCSCGEYRIRHRGTLVNKPTPSCGCNNKEKLVARNTKHGHAIRGKQTQEYTAWENMKTRCYDVKNEKYPDYGARGIYVCDRWLGKNGFINFFSDMGLKPSPDHSLDRFPNNETGIYEPTNCRWGTDEQQSRNKRSNRWYEYNGENLILMDWSKKLNVSFDRLNNYINKHGFEAAYNRYSNNIRTNIKSPKSPVTL